MSSQAKVWVHPETSDILFAHETTVGFPDGGNHNAIYHYRDLATFKTAVPNEKLFF